MIENGETIQERVTQLEQEVAMYREQTIQLTEEVRAQRVRADDMSRVLFDSVGVLGNAIEARDFYTRGHTERVTRMGRAIGQRLGWSQERLEQAFIGGLLHDIGKIGVPDAILQKPGRLTPEEYEIMKRHPRIGAKIMAPIPTLSFVIPYVLCHHERFDGKGYPDGLAGYAIPVEGRVLAIADSFDAMTSDRAYRKGMERTVAIQEVLRCAGSQFDPDLVQVFYQMHQDGEIDRVLDSPRSFDYAL